MEPQKIQAIFISDVHLGSRGSNSGKLLEVLKLYEPEDLFIVGDFIDGWLLKKRHYWTQENTNLIRKILSYSKKGTRVTYITGNHDDFLRHYAPISLGENIQVMDEALYQNYYITHGDLYDGVVQLKWLGMLGSIGYEIAITLDRFMKKLGYRRSLSKYLKNKVKGAVSFITSFEKQLVYQAKKRGCSGVICGHIHTVSDTMIDDVHYLNCGDWIENNSYIVYDQGKFEHRYSL
jgi:UDP-2,3-diacylglucosamine pyrophosphatase LpxH